MSQWHRENPELAGTDADPWMQHESYRKASEEVQLQERGQRAMRAAGYSSIWEAEADSTHICNDEACGEIQRKSASGRCRACGVGSLVEREP